MEWVYIYEDIESGAIGYVGRSKNALRCGQRIAEHRRDPWYRTGVWRLRFCPCVNRAESEGIETEMINRYDPYGNTDKKGWGLFLQDAPSLESMPSIEEPQTRSSPFVVTGFLARIENRIELHKRMEGIEK